MQRFNSTLRSVLMLVAALAIIFCLHARSRQLRALAAKHHYESMAAGYTASAIQKPVFIGEEWQNPAPVKWDRATVEAALPHWQRSTYHASVRDLYLARSRQPWWPVGGLPDEPAVCALPASNDEIVPWWKEQFGSYSEANPCFWDGYMGFEPDEPNFELNQSLLSDIEWRSLSHQWYAERKGTSR